MTEPRKAIRKFPKRVVEKPNESGEAGVTRRRRRPAGPATPAHKAIGTETVRVETEPTDEEG